MVALKHAALPGDRGVLNPLLEKWQDGVRTAPTAQATGVAQCRISQRGHTSSAVHSSNLGVCIRYTDRHRLLLRRLSPRRCSVCRRCRPSFSSNGVRAALGLAQCGIVSTLCRRSACCDATCMHIGIDKVTYHACMHACRQVGTPCAPVGVHLLLAVGACVPGEFCMYSVVYRAQG